METKTRKVAVDLTDLAIGIIILGMITSIGATIVIGTRDSRLTDLDVITTYNETTKAVNETGTRFSNTWVKGLLYATNETSTVPVIEPANYTVTIDDFGTGSIALSGPDLNYNNSLWNVTYEWYNTSRVDWQTANKAAIGLAEYGGWFKIIVIIGIAAVILSLVFLAFSRPGGETGGSY